MCASGDQFDSALGQRVEYQGFHGTIHFVGELTGQNGIWLGIEWDDPNRGKHDGSYNGVSYFQTSHPTSGSFVRPNKVNFGKSFIEALHDRYGKIEGHTAGLDEKEVAEMKKSLNAPLLEFVGFDKVNSKQSQFENLQVVQLQHQPVKCAGMEGEIAAMCPSVIELDLSCTLVSSWKHIADITRQLKKLTHLNISDNKVPVPSVEETLMLKDAFSSIGFLILNDFGYTWEEILICARMFSSVHTLCARHNKIVSLESPSFGVLSNLTALHLQMNQIKDWNHVNKLGNLTSLQILHLSEAGLSNIFFPGEGKTSLFPSLVELSLQANEIDDWISISELNKLVSLKVLQLLLNPIMEKPYAFDMIVARIKGLQMLNRSVISIHERRGSEYDYMKRHGQEWISARNDSHLLRDFLRQHPRYTELVELHGSITEEDVVVAQAPLKSRLVNIKIVCTNLPSLPEYSRKVPKNMTVQKLTGLVQKLMNTGGCVPTLFVISAKTPEIQIPLEKDMQDLSFYSVEDGDTIAVNW